MIRLLSIQCTLNDETDKDEIFIKYNGDKLWPKSNFESIDNGKKLPIDITFNHSEKLLNLELWDFDYLSANDLLGTFTMDVSETGGPYQTDMVAADQNSMASYTLHWEVV